MYKNVVFIILKCHPRNGELKEELALGITMALNAWHLHIGILQVRKQSEPRTLNVTQQHGTIILQVRRQREPRILRIL